MRFVFCISLILIKDQCFHALSMLWISHTRHSLSFVNIPQLPCVKCPNVTCSCEQSKTHMLGFNDMRKEDLLSCRITGSYERITSSWLPGGVHIEKCYSDIGTNTHHWFEQHSVFGQTPHAWQHVTQLVIFSLSNWYLKVHYYNHGQRAAHA